MKIEETMRACREGGCAAWKTIMEQGEIEIERLRGERDKAFAALELIAPATAWRDRDDYRLVVLFPLRYAQERAERAEAECSRKATEIAELESERDALRAFASRAPHLHRYGPGYEVMGVLPIKPDNPEHSHLVCSEEGGRCAAPR